MPNNVIHKIQPLFEAVYSLVTADALDCCPIPRGYMALETAGLSTHIKLKKPKALWYENLPGMYISTICNVYMTTPRVISEKTLHAPTRSLFVQAIASVMIFTCQTRHFLCFGETGINRSCYLHEHPVAVEQPYTVYAIV